MKRKGPTMIQHPREYSKKSKHCIDLETSQDQEKHRTQKINNIIPRKKTNMNNRNIWSKDDVLDKLMACNFKKGACSKVVPNKISEHFGPTNLKFASEYSQCQLSNPAFNKYCTCNFPRRQPPPSTTTKGINRIEQIFTAKTGEFAKEFVLWREHNNQYTSFK